MAQPELTPRLVEAETESVDFAQVRDQASPRRGTVPVNDSSPASTSSKWSALLIAVLAIALVWTAFNLRHEKRTSAALETKISALESLVARAEASVGAHETRLEDVRTQVGDLLSRMGALSSLVTSEVVPEEMPEIHLAPPDFAGAAIAD